MADEVERQLAAVEHAYRARDEFLSVASHELRTPLAFLKTQIQLLERRPKELQERQLRMIARQLEPGAGAEAPAQPAGETRAAVARGGSDLVDTVVFGGAAGRDESGLAPGSELCFEMRAETQSGKLEDQIVEAAIGTTEGRPSSGHAALPMGGIRRTSRPLPARGTWSVQGRVP